MTHIVGMGGTLRTNSTSRRVLEIALDSAQSAGAETTLLDLNAIDLPMYRPNTELDIYDPKVAEFLKVIRSADGMLWSTAAYHGTIVGATKNAIDFIQYLSGGEYPYLHKKAIGLIVTAGGDMGAVNTLSTMIKSVHSLRGIVVPLQVAIGQAYQAFDGELNLTDAKAQQNLEKLGAYTVELTQALRPESEYIEG